MALTKVRGSGLGTLGDGTANDKSIVFDGNAQDYHIGLDDSADTLNIGKGSALGTTTAMTFDANGIITTPLQPMFEVRANATQSISTSSMTKTTLWGTEVFDNNGDFASNTFTVPVDGKYLFQCYLTWSTMVAGAGISLAWYVDDGLFHYGHQQSTEINITIAQTSTVILDLDAAQEVTVYVKQGSGSSEDIGTASNDGSGTNANSNYWTGFLIG